MDCSLRQILQKAASFLRHRGIIFPRSEAELLLSFLLKKERIFFYVHAEETLDSSLAAAYWKLVQRRGEGEPLAYITRQKEFMSLPFYVEEGVLIPRPETEHLVEFVLEWLPKYYPAAKNGAGLKVLDLGTGCGNIAVSLAYYLPAIRIMALDLDEHALRVALVNRKRYQLQDRLELFCGSLVDLLNERDCLFNVVVSNPPYLSAALLTSLSPEVQREPRLALNGGPDGLDLYREIFGDVNRCLLSPGLLALEVGKGQSKEVCSLAHQAVSWKETTIIKDYAGTERICCFRW